MSKNQPKDKRMRDVIETAVNFFLERGFEGTSMDLIAKTSGLSKGGLYHHFESKEQLLLEANNVYFDPIVKLMEEALDIESAVDGLRFFIRGSLRHWAMHQRELVFIFLSNSRMLSKIELWKQIAGYSGKMLQFYEFLFLKGIDSGELTYHDARSRAIALFGAMDGITPYLVMSKEITAQIAANSIEDVYITPILKNV